MVLKIVSHYDLNVLSMSVMGFQQKSVDMGMGGCVGGVSSIQFFLMDFSDCFNFAKPLIH